MPSNATPKPRETEGRNGKKAAPPTPPGHEQEDEYVARELAITARMIEQGHFRGLDGKALTVKEAQERMDRSERYLRWRWEEDHGA
jgi:hypothetical protein